MSKNPVGLDGMEFLEYSGPDTTYFQGLFKEMGMVEVAKHKTKDITLYRQNDVTFLLNNEKAGFANQFVKDLFKSKIPIVAYLFMVQENFLCFF